MGLLYLYLLLLFHVSTALVGIGLFIIDVSGLQLETPHWLNSLDEWSDRRRDLYLTRNIHAPDGIRTYNLSKRAAADPLLKTARPTESAKYRTGHLKFKNKQCQEVQENDSRLPYCRTDCLRPCAQNILKVCINVCLIMPILRWTSSALWGMSHIYGTSSIVWTVLSSSVTILLIYEYLTFCWPCIIICQYNRTNKMHYLPSCITK
jgi:hypothetical protein